MYIVLLYFIYLRPNPVRGSISVKKAPIPPTPVRSSISVKECTDSAEPR